MTFMNRINRPEAIVLVVAMVSSCGDSNAEQPLGSTHVALTEANLITSASDEPTVASRRARAESVAKVQSAADERYAAKHDASGAIEFRRPDGRMRTILQNGAVRATFADSPGNELFLSAIAMGCENDRTTPLGVAEPTTARNKVHVMRPNMREWYVHGPLGLEHGFTVLASPPCIGTKTVTLLVEGHLDPTLQHDNRDHRGVAIVFVDKDRNTIAQYTDLFVKDATGRALPSWFELTNKTLSIHFDDAHATYPVEIDPLLATFESQMLPDLMSGPEWFGGSVAVSDDTAVLGAAGMSGMPAWSTGFAYIFERNGAVWTRLAKLAASDALLGQMFGAAVAIAGDIMVIGAPGDKIGPNSSQGSAYVFVRNGTTWTETTKLVAADGSQGDTFGTSVAIQQDTIVVGAPHAKHGTNLLQGAVYVYVNNGGSWNEQSILRADDPTMGPRLGKAVAIDGNTIVAGGVSTYVFVRNAAMWTQQAQINSQTSVPLGDSVSISGDTLISGALHDGAIGAAYVYVRTGTTWELQTRLIASDNRASGKFGQSVALYADIALVGAESFRTPGNTSENGGTYVFERQGIHWKQKARLHAGDGGTLAETGEIVGYGSNNTALVGAPRKSGVSPYPAPGRAYVYTIQASKHDGQACTAGTECWSDLCVDGVCCNKPCNGGLAQDCIACSKAAGAAIDGLCGPVNVGLQCQVGMVEECQIAATCNGVSTECPAPSNAPNGTSCSTGACLDGVCASIPPVVPPPLPQPQTPSCQLPVSVSPCPIVSTWASIAFMLVARLRRRNRAKTMK